MRKEPCEYLPLAPRFHGWTSGGARYWVEQAQRLEFSILTEVPFCCSLRPQEGEGLGWHVNMPAWMCVPVSELRKAVGGAKNLSGPVGGW